MSERADSSDERVPIHSEQGAPPLGPYSPAIAHAGVLYCSGAIPVDANGELVAGPVGSQVRQCLGNLEAVCAAAGTDLGRALLVTVFTTELGSAVEINEAYAEHFGDRVPPARVMVGVAELPKGAQVEIAAEVAR